MEKSEQKLMSAVESLAPEILDFTSRLVACPSTLGKEEPVLEVMENELRLLGLDPVRVKISPEDLADHPGFTPVPWDYEGRYNLIATRPAEEFVSTATTDLRAFVHFGNGQATCFGPIAENIHAHNERVDISSVIHTAKIYALFLARWCGIID